MGEISGHTGAITALSFFEDDILISASEDHTLMIWRVHDWEQLHILGGCASVWFHLHFSISLVNLLCCSIVYSHKDSVHAMSIHPSGKVLLSVSKDSYLRIWNLVQGRCSYTNKLAKPAEIILWQPECGSTYLTVAPSATTLSGSMLSIIDTNSSDVVGEVLSKSKINHAAYIQVGHTR